MISEGGILLKLSGVSKDEIQELCEVDIRNLSASLKAANRVMASVMFMAHKFDFTSEMVLDTKMCSDLCPCYSKETWSTDTMGNKIIRVDPEYVYNQISEEKLNHHGRTN